MAQEETDNFLTPLRTSKETFATGVTSFDDNINISQRSKDVTTEGNNLAAQAASEKKLSDPTNSNKLQTFIIRTIWTFVMIGAFFFILGAGHFWCILLVVFCQITTFKECISITVENSQLINLPLTRTLNWYFLFTTIYYLDGLSIWQFTIKYMIKLPLIGNHLNWFTVNHGFICYCLYVLGFILFVKSLKMGHLKYQFKSLCITHMVLLLCVFQAHLIIQNILNGLFWFLLPCGLVIVNDIFAYLCGITMGKTKLISISPKKTLEGFLGAWVFTVLASFILVKLLSSSGYMICPIIDDLKINVFSNLTCELNPVFIPQEFRLPPLKIFEKLNITPTLIVKPIYIHAMLLATFASLFAPFGGFFASGLKRAVKAKDFGDSIPGHGGVTDRVDCQFMMGSFTYLYYETFISEKSITVNTILTSILLNLNEKQIFSLIVELNKILYDNNILSLETYNKLLNIYESLL
ncbi:hypothetical protein QEN19_003637 [Hanseniaspora menglaensis]